MASTALQGGIFDTARGLPVHILLVHFLIVGVLLMSVLTVAVAAPVLWRRWQARRRGFAWAVTVLNLLLLGLTWVTVQAGQRLAVRVFALDDIDAEAVNDHMQLGGRMPWFVLGLAVAAALSAAAGSRRVPALVALAVAVVAALAASTWVFLTGESGSAAVWGPIVERTSR